MKYYTPLIVIVWLSLAVLAILTIENDRFSKRKRNTLFLTFSIVAVAALFEWLGVQISGNTKFSPWLLKVVKLFDYILTPIAGGTIILQFGKKNIWKKIMYILLGVNTLFQIISLFTGWMIVINDDNSYSHGPVYFLYIALYLAVIILVIIEFMMYGKRFRKQNVASLYASLGLVIVGIIFQEVLGKEVRLAYISLTICLALLFIHNSEFAQLELDDKFYEQKIKILEDPLTTLYSRYAYNAAIEEMASFKFLANDLVVFLIDVNGLKAVNDRLGHSAGDELIRGAANCIYAAFSHYGKCYRTGGDEFVVIANMNEETIDEEMTLLKDLTKKWQAGKGIELSLSVGYAKANDNLTSNIVELVNLADENMYKEKAEYYEENDEEAKPKEEEQIEQY